MELILPQAPEHQLYLCSDLCENSIIGEYTLPVLRRIGRVTTRPPIIAYVPVKTRELSTVRVYIKENVQDIPSFSSGMFYCVLRFRRDEAVSAYP